MEDAIYDSQAISGFVGINLTHESAPDATTLLKFRRLLEQNNMTKRNFDEINDRLVSKGLTMRTGQFYRDRPASGRFLEVALCC